MSDLVTIVVPIYNVERFLDKCVNSIVTQTYKNLEIILVDDGSPDNCPVMCDEWAKKDNRIKVIHKENQGLGMARNTGIENATGKYIFFLDSDDYVDVSLVEKCIASASNNNADVVWYVLTDLDENGQPVLTSNDNAIKCYSDKKQVREQLLPELISPDYRADIPLRFAFSACTCMFSVDIFRQFGVRFHSEREIISEDSYFLLQYFQYVNCAVTIDEVLYFHYINTSSLTTTYRQDRQEKINHFYEVADGFVKKTEYPEEVSIRLCMLYHSFTLAALKMVFTSNLSNKEKNKISRNILRSLLIKDTLKKEVLLREKKTVRLFYKLASMRLFRVCNLILKFKK